MDSPLASFPCAVASVKTLADGGIRVTLDLPEDGVEAAARLMEAKRLGIVLLADVREAPRKGRGRGKQDKHDS